MFFSDGWLLEQQPHAACSDICTEAATADIHMPKQHRAEPEQLRQMQHRAASSTYSNEAGTVQYSNEAGTLHPDVLD